MEVIAMAKSRRRPVSTDKRFRRNLNLSDTGPKERWQHSGRTLELTEVAGILAARATEEHIVDGLMMRGVLTETQRAAALRFKQDYQYAGLAAHVTGSYSVMPRSDDFFRGGRDRTDAEERAYRRWRNAVKELGLSFSGAVISVTCQDMQPAINEITRLQKGLEILADWYGM
jgi:hypothetical protein